MWIYIGSWSWNCCAQRWKDNIVRRRYLRCLPPAVPCFFLQHGWLEVLLAPPTVLCTLCLRRGWLEVFFSAPDHFPSRSFGPCCQLCRSWWRTLILLWWWWWWDGVNFLLSYIVGRFFLGYRTAVVVGCFSWTDNPTRRYFLNSGCLLSFFPSLCSRLSRFLLPIFLKNLSTSESRQW